MKNKQRLVYTFTDEMGDRHGITIKALAFGWLVTRTKNGQETGRDNVTGSLATVLSGAIAGEYA